MSGRTAERLRDLAGAMGEQIGPRDIPPLRLDVHAGDSWGPAARRWTRGRWVPVMAAAAVLALVISVPMAAHVLGTSHRQHPVDKPPAHLRLPRIVPLEGTPSFLVTSVDGRGYVKSIHGRVIARIPPPARHFLIEGIAAAPGNRIFYLAGVVFGSSSGEDLEFYRIVLSSNGRPGQAQRVAGPPVRLPLPVSSDGLASVAVAASPDGRQLAFSPSQQLDPDPGTRQASITVRSLVTGASRTWRAWPSTSTQISELSWARGGQLSFVATIGQAAVSGGAVVYHGDTEVSGLMILDTTATGTGLMQDSRVIVSAVAHGPAGGIPPSADDLVAGVITSDGQQVLAQVIRHHQSRLVEISVATGKITRVLVSGWRAVRANPLIVDGDNVLFTLVPFRPHRSGLYICGTLSLASVRTGRVAPLPFPVYCGTEAPPEPFLAAW